MSTSRGTKQVVEALEVERAVLRKLVAQKEAVPMWLLGVLRDSGCRAAIEQADIVLGFDVSSGEDVLVYGRALLGQIAADQRARELVFVRFKYDQAEADLEYLVGTVQVPKGHHEYQEGAIA